MTDLIRQVSEAYLDGILTEGEYRDKLTVILSNARYELLTALAHAIKGA